MLRLVYNYELEVVLKQDEESCHDDPELLLEDEGVSVNSDLSFLVLLYQLADGAHNSVEQFLVTDI